MTNEQLTKIKQETWNLASCIQERSDLVAEIFPAGLDAKQNQNIKFFSTVGFDVRGGGELFLKVFVGSQWQAKAEVVNTNILTINNVDGVVPIIDSESSGENTLIVYPHVEGKSFHAVLGQEITGEVMDKTAKVLKVSSKLEGFQKFQVPEAFLKQYPFLDSVFASPIFQQINRAYNPFWRLRNSICEQSPGLSMDRTPRNIMIAGKDIKQIDFEMVYQDSPLFDLAKLLRNGPETGVAKSVNMVDVVASPTEVFEKHNPFKAKDEAELVDWFIETTLGNQDKPLTTYNYWQVAAHTHIFYISKYLRRYNEIQNSQIKENSYQRMAFHFAGLLSLKDKILEPFTGRTEQVKRLITSGVDKIEVTKLFDLYTALADQIK